MIVLTVLFYFRFWTKWNYIWLKINRKEICHHDYIPINFKGKWKCLFSAGRSNIANRRQFCALKKIILEKKIQTDWWVSFMHYLSNYLMGIILFWTENHNASKAWTKKGKMCSKIKGKRLCSSCPPPGALPPDPGYFWIDYP